MIGKQFGKLTVLKWARYQSGNPMLLVRCECGTEKPMRKSRVQLGITKTCGCENKSRFSKWRREQLGK